MAATTKQRPRGLQIPIPPVPAFASNVVSSYDLSPSRGPSLKSPPLGTATGTPGLSGIGTLNAAAAHRLLDQQDYSRLPPDELFTRLSVAEVKGINARLRCAILASWDLVCMACGHGLERTGFSLFGT